MIHTTPVDERTRDVIPQDRPIIVTIDGPAGTGKSTVAHNVALRLGLDVLDTGAMYRAATAIALDHNIPLDQSDQIIRIVADADLHFDWNRDPPQILAWLKPLNDRIRNEDVSGAVSGISAIAPLRAHMVRKQRLIWQQHPRLVSEGRDQGSIVFPEASTKFYLDADPRVRAARRCAQLAAAGVNISLPEMLKRIKKRDHLDSTRADGPLVCPKDAIVIDTTDMPFDEVVDTLVRAVHEHVARA